MGGGHSTHDHRPLSAEEEDMKWLGERFPYGDAELRHIYRAYQRLLLVQEDHGRSSSFLQDWAVECRNPPLLFPENSRKSVSGGVNSSTNLKQDDTSSEHDRSVLIQLMEDQILGGTRLGNCIFQVACLLPNDVPWYNGQVNQQGSSSNSNNSTKTDEYTRKARLEQLFQGFTDMTRRGAKQTLTILFQAVSLYQQQKQKQEQSPPNDQAETKSVSAKVFVEFGYRMALATGFLQALLILEKRQQHIHKVPLDDDNNNNNDDHQASPPPPPQTKSSHLLTQASILIQQFLPKDHDNLDSLAQSLLEKARSRSRRFSGGLTTSPDTNIELSDVLEWSESVAPLFSSILPTLIFYILFWKRPFPPTQTTFEFPIHQNDGEPLEQDSHPSEKKIPVPHEPSILDATPLSFALACASRSLMGQYFRLYTSAADGLSFNRLLNALLGYSGPTLMIIRSTRGAVFGAFTSQTWKESKDFYGSSDCFLFRLLDSVSIYRPTGQDKNFMYCNSVARSKGYDQQAHGIGFGGTVQQPRLFIAENLAEECRAASQDLTFENGELMPQGSGSSFSVVSKQFFEIESMEVWGVGGSEIVGVALDERRKARELRDEGIRRARKVDKAQFLDDFRSGAIDAKVFAFQQQIDGRADQDVKDRNAQRNSN